MSDSADEIAVPARFTALPELLGQLCQRTEAAGLGAECQFRMQLAVEELFANTIHHGYGGECDALVWLSVSCSDGQCRLRYRDTAPAFDPLQAPVPPPGPDRLGGAGLHLLRRLIDSGSYVRSDGGNQIELVFIERG